MSRHGPTPRPCGSCPYRRDVPSGVWAADEYDKLPAYDRDTPSQPPAAFFCHQRNGRLCAGWVGCHDMDHSLGLRFALSLGAIDADDFRAAVDYECPVPLWGSGVEAAEHGRRDIEAPSIPAQRTMDKLHRRRARRVGAAP